VQALRERAAAARAASGPEGSGVRGGAAAAGAAPSAARRASTSGAGGGGGGADASGSAGSGDGGGPAPRERQPEQPAARAAEAPGAGGDGEAAAADSATAAGAAAEASAAARAADAAADDDVCCDHCGGAAAAGRRLLLCTRCREARYCGEACQAAAWGGHKGACTAALRRRRAQPAAAPAQPPQAAPARGGAKGAAAADAVPGAGADAGAAGGASQADVLSALGNLLQRHADGAADALQGAFEAAVVRFVRGDYRGAVPALQEVSAKARAEARRELAGDALRWLGHAQNRLGAPARAAAAFAEGAEIATAAGSKRLQVDCLSGLGVVARGQGQHQAAVGYLRQALAVADSMGAGSSATRASVLTNLGTALMALDAAEAADKLREAVALREAQVGPGPEGGCGAQGLPGAAPGARSVGCCCTHPSAPLLTAHATPAPPPLGARQVMELHRAGEKNGLATAIMEHAGALVNLAGALYVEQAYAEARDAYQQALEVFDMVGDADKVAKSLVNLANLHELQVRGARSRGGVGSGHAEARVLAAAPPAPWEPWRPCSGLGSPRALPACAGRSAHGPRRPRTRPRAPQLMEPGCFEAAAACRRRLFALAKEHLGRDTPDTCCICLGGIDPLNPTEASPAAAANGGVAGAAAAGADAAPVAAEAEVAGANPAAAAGEGDASAAAEASTAAAANGSAEQEAAEAAGEAGADGSAPRDQLGGEAAAAAPESAKAAGAAGAAAAADDPKARRVLMLACLHCFHHGCFREWSERNENTSCPSCKQPVPLY
jgi:tetratricopeptide (TPR) repeat protein